MSVNDFCDFWNFHYNGKNWLLTTLWGLFVVLKFCFKGKLFNLKIETKLKNGNDFSDQRLRMPNSLIVRHLILRVLWRLYE